MRRRHLWLIAIVALLGLWLWTKRSGNGELHAPGTPVAETARGTVAPAYPAFLPMQAHVVLERIAHGQPHPYRQDGDVFQNRERRLPPQSTGYYREYTVETPGSGDRGARRLITGGDPPVEYWYTDDHYRTFRRFQLAQTPQ